MKGQLEQRVLDELKRRYPEWATPTQVGMALGYSYDVASSRIAPVLKRLVAKSLVETAGRGRYRVATGVGG